MSFIDRLESLLSESHISKNQMLKDLGLGGGTLATWKKRGTTPSGEILSKLASYFNVSTDYLLGNTDIKAPSTSSITFDDFTVAMHNQSDRLTEEQKLQLLKMAELFAKDNEGK